MKERYTFDINDNHIVCYHENNNHIISYTGFKAENNFRKMDQVKFLKIIANKKHIKLCNNNIDVVIKNIDKFSELYFLDKYLPKTTSKIKSAIKKYQIECKKNQINKNVKINGKKVFAGALTCSLLISAYSINQISKEKEITDKATITSNDNSIINYNLLSNYESNQTATKNVINLDIECKYNSVEYKNVVDNYGEIIEQYANKWGISPSIIIAIISQESGGRYNNLMNILFESWEDQILKIYNHEDNCYTKLVLTNNKNKYSDDILCISSDELINKKTNISCGCAILAYNLKYFDYNIPLAITSYNCGPSGVDNILKATSYATGINVNNLISDPSSNEFLNYTYVIDPKYGGSDGDKEYLKHVLRYVENKENVLYAIDENNIIHSLSVNFQNINSKQY